MHAIVRVAGVQARVAPGERIRIPRTEAEVGSEVTLGDVLLLSDGEDITVGTPVVDGASVVAEIVGHHKADKVHVMKKKRRKRYRLRRGHRQQYTEVLVKEITGEGGEVLAAPEQKPAPAAEEPEIETAAGAEADAAESAAETAKSAAETAKSAAETAETEEN